MDDAVEHSHVGLLTETTRRPIGNSLRRSLPVDETTLRAHQPRVARRPASVICIIDAQR
jgi:hypothetical protein